MTRFWNCLLWLLLFLGKLIGGLANIPIKLCRWLYVATFLTSSRLGRRMTLENFLEYYRTLKDEGWKARIGWGNFSNAVNLNHIKVTPVVPSMIDLDAERGNYFCDPISAVLVTLTGQFYPYLFPYIPGRQLGLSEATIRLLMLASDKAEGYDPELRRRLLEPFHLAWQDERQAKAA